MLGKLKEMAGAGALDKLITSVEPHIRLHLAKVQTLGAELIQSDPQYVKYVIEPAYVAVVSASSGATKLIPGFQERFNRLMLALRDELVVFEGTAVRLVEDFQSRLPKIITDSLKG